MSSKICYYYQTFNGLQSILDNPSSVDIIMISSIHFGVNKDGTPYIHLNDNVPNNKVFDGVWSETKTLSQKDVKIMLMMGGAGGAYNYLFENYKVYYPMIVDTIREYNWITGIDLDIEEYVNIEDVKQLMTDLKRDLGDSFIITMAPIQAALMTDGPGLGGFSYKELYSSPEGKYIDHFNVQCYSSFTFEAIEKIINNGYPSEKIIMGMLGGDYDPVAFGLILKEVGTIKDTYDNIGGVFCWEYCNSPPDIKDPGKWASEMTKILKPGMFKLFCSLGKHFIKSFTWKITEE